MNIFDEALERNGRKYQHKLAEDKDGNIDFNKKETQVNTRLLVVDSLAQGGYVALSMLVSRAWKIED